MNILHYLLMLITVMLTACTEQTSSQPENVAPDLQAVAKVNETLISQDVVDLFIQQRANANRATLSNEQQEELINQVINFELLAQDAMKNRLDRQSPVSQQLQVDRMETLAAASIREYFETHPITEEMLQAEYQKTLSELDGIEYNARHILVDTEQQARDLIEQLNDGADFDALARRSSIEPGAEQRAGDLGWFTAGQMVKPFAVAINAMVAGQISNEPVQTKFGWHVIDLRETRDAPLPNFEDLRQQLEFQVKSDQIEGYVNMLRGAANIQRTERS